jgi:hypothetical protein
MPQGRKKQAPRPNAEVKLTWRPTQYHRAAGAPPIHPVLKTFKNLYDAVIYVMEKLNELERGSARITLASGQIIDINKIEAMYKARKKKRGTD